MNHLAQNLRLLNQVAIKNKHYQFAMKSLTFDAKLKGMTELDRSLFKAKISLPAIKVPKKEYGQVRRILRNQTLESFVSTRKYQNLSESDPLYHSHKFLIFDPDMFGVETLEADTKTELAQALKLENAADESLRKVIESIEIEISYEDLKFEEVIKAIIPDELAAENVTVKGYSIIGHIAHFNLRDQLSPYKKIIGETLVDKIAHIKTVVNKLNEIDNTYRNFEFEILAGEANTLVNCRENGCDFRFDFAKVYWNPRLSTEHERVVKLFNANDVVYDVFAGVGPFSIPAVSRRGVSSVLANDLNPESYRYLIENFKQNNKSKTRLKELETRRAFVKGTVIPEFVLKASSFKFSPHEAFVAFNMDGREFIRSKVKFHLIEILNYRLVNKIDLAEDMNRSKYNVLMNLPALSLEFLDSFNNLYDPEETTVIRQRMDARVLRGFRLSIFCYHFCKGDEAELENIKQSIKKDTYKDENLVVESKWVRKVAPAKDMYCTMFKLGFEHLLYNQKFAKISHDDKQKLNDDQNKGEIGKPVKIQRTQ